ncbi:MAG: hypothetical protein JWL65_795 [Gammaproteobacteria bacterium]|jgi:hypothetical protein|nr:hypothetical protein [Gammaproteobacteria bacterium]
MPFTFAHPAAVLPLRRRFKWLQTVPLIVGSVAPDLPYFIPGRFNRVMLETHTLSGSFWADIPIGMVVLLFGFLFRRPLVALLRPRARALCLQAMEHFKDQPLHWVLAPLGILVGTWTHVLWDSFTHDNGWMVRRVAVLSAPITLGDYTGSLCHILQYVSSLAGLLIMIIWYLRLPTPKIEPPAVGTLSSSGRIALLMAVCVAAAAIGGYKAALIAMDGLSNYRVIYTLLTRSIAWFALLYLLAGLFVSFTRKPEPVAEI